MLGFGRWSSIILVTSLCVIALAGMTRAPAVAREVERGGGLLPVLLTRTGLGHLAPVPAQPFARVASPVWAETDGAVRQMQERIAGNPTDPTAFAAHAQLGSLYLQKVRETGDPSYYASAEAALRKSLELRPDNVLAQVGMGGLTLARHQFTEALQWGEAARAQAPRNYIVHGIIADALIELGQYEAAVEALQRMIDLRPDLASLSRVSYARELHGDLSGAIDAMRRAVAAGSPVSEGTNWARIQLGHLLFLTGDLDAAEREYDQTLASLPDYVHGLAGRARVAAARGDLKNAIRQYEQALTLTPLPEYATALAAVYRAAGQPAAAERQEALVRAITQVQRAGGVDVDLDLALFEVDHARDARAAQAALETARAAYSRRPESVHAADVLAWALHRAGQSEEALPHARSALRLGTKDPVMLYHAGAIAAAVGERAEARQYLQEALARNDRFHVRFAPEAKRLLEQVK